MADTTREGVSQAESAAREEGGPYRDELHPRRNIMADIAKNAREQREGQFSERDGSEEDEQRKTQARTDPTPEPEPEPEPEAKADPDPQPDPEPEPAPRKTAEPTVMVEINGEMQEVPASKVRTRTKINGQEQEVAGEELLRGYQMTSAGQARLREAREMQRQLEERERALREREQQLGQGGQQQPTQQGQPNTRPASMEEEAAKIAHALQFGDEQESAQAVQRLTELAQNQGRTDSGATPDDMVNAVYERVSFEVQDRNAYQSGIDSFRREYPHLANDPGLARLATDYVNQVRARDLSEIGYDVSQLTPQQMALAHAQEAQKGTVPGYADTFREAGQLTDRWLQNVSGAHTQAPAAGPTAPADQPSSGFEHRQEAKRRTAQPPRTASGRASAGPSKPQLQTGATPQERVQWLRQQRGQA